MSNPITIKRVAQAIEQTHVLGCGCCSAYEWTQELQDEADKLGLGGVSFLILAKAAIDAMERK